MVESVTQSVMADSLRRKMRAVMGGASPLELIQRLPCNL